MQIVSGKNKKQHRMRNKTMIFFEYPLCHYGGAETLILRMSKWLQMNNYHVVIFSYKIDINNKIYRELRKYATIIKTDDKYISYTVLCNYLVEEINIFIHFSLASYLNAVRFYSINRSILYNIIYVIHPETLINSIFKIKKPYISLLKLILFPIIRQYINRMETNGNIVYMDAINYWQTMMFYKIPEGYKHIVPLPVTLEHKYTALNTLKDNILSRRNNNIIIAVARSDFPFKGYIVSLLYEFQKIRSQYKNVKLLVVTDNILRLKHIYEERYPHSMDYLQNVELKENVAYYELMSIMSNSILNIGMGTTILDAALKFVPSIVVKSYTYECLTTGFFHDNPTGLTVHYTEKIAKILDEKQLCPIDKYILQILSMSNNEYYNICLKSHRMVCDHYDIDKNIPSLLKIATSSTQTQYFDILAYAGTYLRQLRDLLKNTKSVCKK